MYNSSKLDQELFKIKTHYLKEKENSVSLLSPKIPTFYIQKYHPVLNHSFRRKKKKNHIHIFRRGGKRPQLLKIWFGDKNLPAWKMH